MKKKVRIYKAPDGQGKVINKLNKFLSKAQEGGMPDPNVMGYPQETEGPNEDQLSQMIISDISNGRPKEETVMKIANSSGLDPMSIDQFYEQIYSSLESQRDAEAEDEVEEDETEDQYTGEESEPVQEIEEDFYGDDVNNDIANDVASEDEEEDYSDEDAFASDLVMRHGGSYKKAKNAFVKQQVSLVKKQAGGAEQTKTNDADPIGTDFRKNKLQAFIGTLKDESAQAKAKEQAEQQFDQMMQQQQMMQPGMSGVPMAQDGLQTGMDIDPGFSINPSTGKRWTRAEVEAAKQKGAAASAERTRMDDWIKGQMIGASQQNPYGQGYQVPNIYGNQMMAPRRGLFGRPKMPRGFGFGYGMPPVTKMDVRRTGLFGRPKEYSMEFGMPSVMPGMGFPGMGAGFYGYGQTTKQGGKTKGRIITEEVAKVVNNEATKEVAANTPGNTATDKPNDGAASNTTPGSTASNVQENTGADGQRKAIQVNDEATDAVVNNSEATREKKKQKNLYNQGLPGSSYDYARLNGEWGYWDEEKQDYIKIGNEGSLARLEAGENKSASYVTLPNNKGYYYRKANDGSYIKFKGDPKNHTAQTQPVGKITKKNTVPFNNLEKNQVTTTDKDYGYADLLKFPNAPKPVSPAGPTLSNYVDKVNLLNSFGPKYETGGQAYYNPFGGFVDSENPDLYKFIYGGDDIDQADIDDMYAKDTTDPYFQTGGTYDDYRKQIGDKLQMSLRDDLSAKELFELGNKAGVSFGNTTKTTTPTTTTTQNQQYNPYANVGYNGFNAFGSLFPANIATNRGSWAQMRRGPYDKLSGANIPGMGFGPNTQVQSLDVTKSGMFGRPKKYTINYGNQEMDPRKQNLITLPGQGTTPAAQSTGAGRTFSNTEGLGAGATGAIRRGERRTARELARGEKQNLSASDANLDPYAGFPLDHPIRDEEKLETNSVKDYLKPSQKSPSSLGLSPFVAAPAQQKLDDSNVPNAFKDPIGNTLQNEKAAKDKQDQISGKSFEEYGDVSTDLNNPNIQQEYQKIYAEQGPDAASTMMDKQFANRNNAIDTRLADEKMQTQKDYDNTMQQNYMEDQGFGDMYQEPSEQSNTSSTNPYASNADYGLGFEPEADESFDKGYFGNQSIDRYDKYRQQMERQAAANRQPTTNRPVQNNQPVQRASPEEFQRRLDQQVNQGNNPNLSKAENVINSNFNKISELERLSFEAGKKNDFKLRDSIDKQIEELEKQKKQSKKELGYSDPDYIENPDDYLYRRMLKNKDYENRKNKFIEDKRLLKPKWLKQFGGDLSRFTGGGNSPVTYTDNPALVGMSNVDMLTLNEGIQGLQPTNFWNDQQSFNEKVPVNTQKQPEEIKMDKAQLSSDQAKKEYQATPGNFSMDFKTKNTWDIDAEGALATANAGIRGAAGLIDRFRNKGREQKMYEGMNAENLYAVDPSRDRGDYDTNTGLYRAADMGQTWNSRSKQYGGAMDDYYEDEEVDMTEEELADFLANGGEVEYL
jgi:hypothetical protein